MTYDSQKHHRRSIRLKGYDYSQAGAYFVTICAEDRACLFGDVVDDQMDLNEAGRMVLAEWTALPVRFPAVELDVFGVMPNHIHGVIVIAKADTVGRPAAVGATLVVAPDPAPPATSAVAPSVPVLREGERAVVARPGATTRVAPTGTLDPASPASAVGECGSATVARPGATTRVAPTPPVSLPALGDVVGAFKSLTMISYIRGVKQSGWPPFRGRLWQRNYHEHIIRNEEALHQIRQYILNNPVNWAIDEENPQVERPVKKKA